MNERDTERAFEMKERKSRQNKEFSKTLLLERTQVVQIDRKS
jgi:hypothetical protein